MEALYQDTHRQLQSIQNGLCAIERERCDQPSSSETQMLSQIDIITKNCDRLDMLASKEPPIRRLTVKHRVEQLKNDIQHCRQSMNRVQHRRYVREQENRDRDILLSTNFTTNTEMSITIDDAAITHHSRLGNAHKEIDDIIDTAKATTASLFTQRSTLKAAQRRILDIAATLGLSTVTMRAIERRALQDKWIMRVGMCITLLVMFFIWRYLT